MSHHDMRADALEHKGNILRKRVDVLLTRIEKLEASLNDLHERLSQVNTTKGRRGKA